MSIFAVTGEAKAISPATQPPAEEKKTEEKKPLETLQKGPWKIILIVIGFIVAVIVAVYLRKHHNITMKLKIK